MLILSGSSHPRLARSLADALGVPMVDRNISQFPDGGIRLRVNGNVRGETVIVVQSFQEPISTHMLELLLLADATRSIGASKIIAVVSWLAYSKQDRAFLPGEPASARVVANMVSTGSFNRVVLVDLHNAAIKDFFRIPVTHLTFMDEFVARLRSEISPDTMVVAPDAGGVRRSIDVAQKLGVPMVRIEKERSRVTGVVTVASRKLPVGGKQCIIVDDLIETGATVSEVGRFLKDQGAVKVIFCATHGLFTEGWTPILASGIDRLYVSDSVPTPAGAPPFVSILPLAPVLARALKQTRI